MHRVARHPSSGDGNKWIMLRAANCWEHGSKAGVRLIYPHGEHEFLHIVGRLLWRGAQYLFSPLHLLSSIKAAFSGLVSHFNALRVEDGRAGGFFFALFLRTFSRRASLMRCQTPSFCQLAK